MSRHRRRSQRRYRQGRWLPAIVRAYDCLRPGDLTYTEACDRIALALLLQSWIDSTEGRRVYRTRTSADLADLVYDVRAAVEIRRHRQRQLSGRMR